MPEAVLAGRHQSALLKPKPSDPEPPAISTAPSTPAPSAGSTAAPPAGAPGTPAGPGAAPAGTAGEAPGPGTGSAGTGMGPDVLVTYSAGTITRRQFDDYLRGHYGFGLSQAQGDAVSKVHAAAALLQRMVVDDMMLREAEARGLTRDEGVRRALQHLPDDENIEEVVTRLDAQIPKPTAREVGSYYEEHSDQYKGLPLAAVQKSIVRAMIRERSLIAFEDYLQRLKEELSIRRDFGVVARADAAADAPVFSVNGKAYTVAQYQDGLNRMTPEERRRLADRVVREEYLESLVTRCVLVDAAGTVADAGVRGRLEQVRRALLLDTLHHEDVDRRVQVDEAEVAGAYERAKERWPVAAQARWSAVALPEGKTDAEQQAARAMIEQIRTAIAGGAGFTATAKQFLPRAPKIAAQDDSGWVGEYDHVPDVFNGLCPFHERTFQSLTPGVLSEAFEMSGRLYIIKVLERRQRRQPRRDEVEPFLRDDLWAANHDQAEGRYLGDILGKANLKVNNTALMEMARQGAGARDAVPVPLRP